MAKRAQLSASVTLGAVNVAAATRGAIRAARAAEAAAAATADSEPTTAACSSSSSHVSSYGDVSSPASPPAVTTTTATVVSSPTSAAPPCSSSSSSNPYAVDKSITTIYLENIPTKNGPLYNRLVGFTEVENVYIGDNATISGPKAGRIVARFLGHFKKLKNVITLLPKNSDKTKFIDDLNVCMYVCMYS